MLTFLQFNFKFSSYMDQMTFAEQMYLYEMYKYDLLKFSINSAIIEINKLRTIKISHEAIIKELAY